MHCGMVIYSLRDIWTDSPEPGDSDKKRISSKGAEMAEL
jgi:hypothetical protein